MTDRLSLAGYQAARRKKPKYRNKPVVRDGVRFQSTGEANRWADLQLLQHAGKISRLRRQVTYVIKVNGVKICSYVADFVYIDWQLKRELVEDWKSAGTRTPAYRLKKLLMKAVHGIEILETGVDQ